MAKSKGGANVYKKQLQETHDRIETGLQKAKLSKSQRHAYQTSLFRIIDKLTPSALARLHKFAREYRFYDSHVALTYAVKEKYPGAPIKPGALLKGMFDKDGTIHLNGEGELFGMRATLQEFQAHEIAHAIDGHRELSSTDEWSKVWKAEIADGAFLGKHSMKSAHEGWADFGTLVLGTGISIEKIGEVLPRALTFWHQRGLL